MQKDILLDEDLDIDTGENAGAKLVIAGGFAGYRFGEEDKYALVNALLDLDGKKPEWGFWGDSTVHALQDPEVFNEIWVIADFFHADSTVLFITKKGEVTMTLPFSFLEKVLPSDVCTELFNAWNNNRNNNKIESEKTNEDLESKPLLSFKGMTLNDVYDAEGANTFDEVNIPLLKEAGLISEDGYPIKQVESWDGELYDREMDCSELYEMDSKFISSPFIQELFKKEIRGNRPVNEDGSMSFNYTEYSLPDFRNLDPDFIKGCFSEDVWNYFDYGDYSYSDCSHDLDDIPEEVFEELAQYGIPKDIFERLERGNEDEDAPYAAVYDQLRDAVVRAYSEGYHTGSVNDCLKDFEQAWKDSIPDGLIWDSQHSTDERRPIIITSEYLNNLDNLKEIWDYYGYYSGSAWDNTTEYIKDCINELLKDNFSEPYYGWNEFDTETFQDVLIDAISEIDFIGEIETGAEVLFEPGEKDLLNFNGETGEYDEDLDVVGVELERPKKLFYKYKEYNKELSSKAYRLDEIRLEKLLDFLHKSNKKHTYIDTAELIELENAADYPEEIILSSIKPSYSSTYLGQPGYTIWLDCGDYETSYLGWIPKEFGDNLIHGILEELEIDVVPVPDIEIGDKYFTQANSDEFLEELISRYYDKPNWFVFSREFGEIGIERLNKEGKTLNEVFPLYQSWKPYTSIPSPNDSWMIGRTCAAIAYCPSEEDCEENPELDLSKKYFICGKWGKDALEQDTKKH